MECVCLEGVSEIIGMDEIDGMKWVGDWVDVWYEEALVI